MEIVALLNWLAVVGVVPRYSLIKHLIQNSFRIARTDDFTSLMRVGLNYALNCKRGVREFWSGQMHLVQDWFVHGEEHQTHIRPEFITHLKKQQETTLVRHVALDHNQKRASWDWFMRQQEEWHCVIVNRTKENVKNEFWESALGEVEVKGYTVVPLTTSHQLVDEGKDMHHCVGSYAYRCMNNESLVFSIRKGSVKIATLELRNEVWKLKTGIWKVNQISGACNSQPTEEIRKIGEMIARKYNKAIGRIECHQEV